MVFLVVHIPPYCCHINASGNVFPRTISESPQEILFSYSEMHCLAKFTVDVMTSLLSPVAQTTGRIVVFVEFVQMGSEKPMVG